MLGVGSYIGGYAAFTAASWAAMRAYEMSLERRWAAAFAAGRVGSALEQTRDGRAIVLRGELSGLGVTVLSEYTDHENTIIHHSRVVVRLPERVPGDLVLKPREFWGDTHATGDESFDALVHLTGDRDRALALMSPSIREAVVALSEDGWTPEIRRDKVSLTYPGPLDGLLLAVEGVVGIAVRLRESMAAGSAP